MNLFWGESSKKKQVKFCKEECHFLVIHFFSGGRKREGKYIGFHKYTNERLQVKSLLVKTVVKINITKSMKYKNDELVKWHHRNQLKMTLNTINIFLSWNATYLEEISYDHFSLQNILLVVRAKLLILPFIRKSLLYLFH